MGWFSIFSKKKQEENLQEFTFIWYKKIVVKNTTHYTAPFRTKIKARTRVEAIDKLADLVLTELKLCIVEEKDFHREDIFKLQKYFNDEVKKMENIFNDL